MTNKMRYGFKGGRYCTGCNSVWEMVTDTGAVGFEAKYPGFPSYGLERQDCSKCRKIQPKTMPTLIQKAAMKYQELFTKHVKKHSK